MRNDMNSERPGAFEEMTRLYGTLNASPSQPRDNYRIRGGAAQRQSSKVPQNGRFQHLKELIMLERANETTK